VHSYLITWRAKALPRALGACHAIEIPFVFGNQGHPLARPFSGLNGDGARFARRLQRSWLGFARGADPGHDRLPTWPRYRPGQRATMILGRECSLADAPLEAERELLVGWKALRGASRNGVARPPSSLRPYLQPSTS
jgi:para-nitrobenzyl esterase